MGGKGGTKSSDGVRKGMGKVGMNQTGGGDNNKTKGGAVRYLGTGGSGTGSPKDCKESNRHGKNGKFAEHNEQQENTEGPILFEKHQRTKKQMLHDSSDSKQKLVKNVNETNRDKRTKKTYKKDGVSEKESHGVRRLRLITAP